MNMPIKFNIVFDGPPGHEAGRFVEVETTDGKSFKVGEWAEQTDGYWHLQIDCSEIYERGRQAGIESQLIDN